MQDYKIKIENVVASTDWGKYRPEQNFERN